MAREVVLVDVDCLRYEDPKSGIIQKEIKMKKLKLVLVLGLAVLLVSVFALPGPAAAAEKKNVEMGDL
jgi:hypothetical protein